MKKHFLSLVFLLILCSASTIFSQRKPAWLNSIEESTQQDKLNPKIINQTYVSGPKNFHYVLFLQMNEGRATIDIRQYFFLQNAKDDFAGYVTAFSRFDKLKDLSKSEIAFGDEGYFWTNPHIATALLFRKKDIYITINTPDKGKSLVDPEELAKTLARIIEKHLP